ncbi:MAG: hypothetical protein LLF98_08535 [Clostridium sp.]|uniref:hypothetical protein n=1 Tax=Clostridium sp. TaxID=1506 RepID=UPI0025B7D739|nr:hypothetical protein [Clostridium sp.]MCE5221296.1 hypothetical protein [Clostridium sp.]
MKKFITIFSIFLFLSFSMNITTTVAQPKKVSEGFYYAKDINIMENVKYTIQNVSPSYESFIIIFDDKERIQQAARLEPNSQKHILLPIKSNYKITIIGKGELTFS